MKRILSLLLTVALVLSLGGCAALQANNDDRLQVVCTLFPPYDFVRQVAGEAVAVTLLLDPGQEAHTYEPTPKDIVAIQNCDLFICGGGESEAWVADILASIGKDVRVLKLLDCVPLTENTHDHADEHEHEADEHVWTSPKNAIAIVGHITDALCALDTAHADAFRTAASDYTANLSALDVQIQTTVDTAARRHLVFADRFPFRYFADAYGLSWDAAYLGCDSHAEPSAATVTALIDRVKAEGIPVVLYIEFSNRQLADTLCEATGAKQRLFHSCHNVTADELAAGATYLSLMTDNLSVLKEALS